MGVMSCHRNGCDNIMCDTYVDDIGYVCYECEREFKDYLKINNITATTEGSLKRELKIFMDSEKDTYTEGKDINVDDFFDSHRRHY